MDEQMSRVYDAYEASAEYKLAVDTWYSEMVRGGIVMDENPEMAPFCLDLIAAIVRQLVLVGFVVVDPEKRCVLPRATVEWHKETATWISRGEADKDLLVCVTSAPVSLGTSDAKTLTSPGYAALSVHEQLTDMVALHQQRDRFNSLPTMYTTANPNITTGDLLRPAFVAPRGASVIIGPSGSAHGGQADHTSVARRHELLESLMRQSRELRTFSRMPFAAGAGFPEAVASDHSEFMISDGQVMASEARHLQPPVSDFGRHFQKLRQMLFQTLGVPPQALGENVNSERLAGSAAITDLAIRLYYQRITAYRERINQLMRNLQCSIRPFVSEADVVRYAPLFKPDVHRELIATALGVPVDFLVANTQIMSQAIDTKDTGIKPPERERGDPSVGI